MKTWILLMASLFLGGTASAAVQAEEVIIIKKPESRSDNTVFLVENSSAANRVGKSFSITAQLLGAGPSRLNAAGVSAGLFLSRKAMLMADFTEGGFYSASSTVSVHENRTRSFGLHLKGFFGNSFYTRLGVDHRISTHSYQYTSSADSSFNSRWTFTGQSTGASLVLGNQWQWEYFTLGCDWIGVLMPFSWKVDSESTTGYKYSSTRREMDDDQKFFLAGTAAHFLRFYLGASF